MIDGAARAAVGDQHVAVEVDGALAERLEVDDAAQRAPDQPLDLDRAPVGAAARGVARLALARSRRGASRTRRSASRGRRPTSSAARPARRSRCRSPACARPRSAPSRSPAARSRARIVTGRGRRPARGRRRGVMPPPRAGSATCSTCSIGICRKREPTLAEGVDVAGAQEAVVALAARASRRAAACSSDARDRARERAARGDRARTSGPEHALEHRRDQRVVRAAEDHRVDARRRAAARSSRAPCRRRGGRTGSPAG